MREAEPDTNIATIVVAVLSIAGAVSFAFAGITMFEKSIVNANSANSTAVQPG